MKAKHPGHAGSANEDVSLEEWGSIPEMVASSSNLRNAVVKAGLAVVLVMAGVAGFAAFRSSVLDGSFSGATETQNISTFVTELRPLVINLTLVGTFEPGMTRVVSAPYDGSIRERRFEFGDTVQEGQILFVLDDQDIRSRIRDAQAQLLRSARIVEDIRNWESSPDVMRGRRTVSSALITLGDLKRQAIETKRLLDRGIVARNEYDQIQQQVRLQEQSLAGAQQDLDAVVARGAGENRKIAELELANAQARVDDLESQLAGASIISPRSGLILRPPALLAAQPSSSSVEPGTRLGRGQPLIVIADTSQPNAVVQVDEIDINKIKIGQSAEVTGDAFDEHRMFGNIISIASQPIDGQTRTARFEVKIKLNAIPPDIQTRLRTGMSARVSITTYEKNDAIIIPIKALRGSRAEPRVLVKGRDSEAPRLIPISVGQTIVDGIEVVSGLEVGQYIIIP